MKEHSNRPEKPRPDFPLYAHSAGYWAKKVRGKVIYFSKWREDPKGVAAFEMWLDQKEASRSPRKYNVSIPRDLETICLKCLEETAGQTISGRERTGGRVGPLPSWRADPGSAGQPARANLAAVSAKPSGS